MRMMMGIAPNEKGKPCLKLCGIFELVFLSSMNDCFRPKADIHSSSVWGARTEVGSIYFQNPLEVQTLIDKL